MNDSVKPKAKKKTGKVTTSPTPSNPLTSDFLGQAGSNLISLFGGGATGGVATRQRVSTKPKQPAPQREQSGILSGVQDFFAIGGSQATDILSAPLTNPNSALRTGNLGGFDFSNFSIDLGFDPAEAGRRTAEQVL